MMQCKTDNLNIIKYHLKIIGNLTQAIICLSGITSQTDSVYNNKIEEILHYLSNLVDLEIYCINQEIESLE